MSEIIFLAILALIVVGPKELPQLARTLGRFLNELKRSSNILTDEIKQHTRLDRFDLNDTLDRPSQVQQAEQNQEFIDPNQMELSEQTPPKEDSDGNKS